MAKNALFGLLVQIEVKRAIRRRRSASNFFDPKLDVTLRAGIASGKALKEIGKQAYDTALARLGGTGTCTKENVRVRKEW